MGPAEEKVPRRLLEVHWTAATVDEARRVCRNLVQERLVACAQVVPAVESIYLWNNQLETTQELLVILKTRLELADKVREVILENSSYELPQILFFESVGGLKEYIDWVEENACNLPTTSTS